MKILKNYWLGIPIGKKTKLIVGLLIIAMALSVGLSFCVMRFSLTSVNRIMNQIMKCENAQEAMQQEETLFRNYVREKTPENEQRFRSACEHTRNAISLLPFSYEEIGAERYAKTFDIMSSYENYSAFRDQTAAANTATAGAVRNLYRVFTMQGYIEGYLRTLGQMTSRAGGAYYAEKYRLFQSLPYFLLAIAVLLIPGASALGSVFSSSIVTPLQKLAEAVQRFGAGNLEDPDVAVENRDEVGALVTAFNAMKRLTRKNINTLQEKQRLEQQLHREEISRSETERQLYTTRLNLLQSQVNPHFLFNTLNTIAGMAELEQADTTDQMIRSLSNIFRYNLHTTEQFVSLRQELGIMRDYMYLQQMRFGERLQYELYLDDSISQDAVTVPAFTLQPLAENAVSHGINKKEDGGTVTVRASMDGNTAVLTVEDTGVGMPEHRLSELRMAMEDLEETEGSVKSFPDRTEKKRTVGIGIGNLYRRVRSIYRDGSMEIESREGAGTRITLRIPQEE